MAIYYFTESIEAELIASITGKAIQKFLEVSIVSRFEYLGR